MHSYAIGIDIGATNTDIGLVRNDGQVLSHVILSSQNYDQADSYMADIIEGIQRLMNDHAITSITGIGIGAPNGNYQTGCIEENTANLRIKTKIPLGETLSKSFHTPVKLDNDANAAALGELVYGGAKGMKHFIMLTLGTGVGSGIVIDGQLLHGSRGAAGELGHTIVEPDGRPCSCGRRGCIETYASARGICQTYIEERERIGEPMNSEALSQLTCKFVGESANRDDEAAIRTYKRTAYWLGVTLANAAAFSEPEAIFLMGGPTRAGEALMNPLRHYFEENLLFLYKHNISVRLSQLNGNDAAILGAAALSTL